MITTKDGKIISKDMRAAEAISELSRYYDLFKNNENMRRDVLRSVSSAIVNNINSWCGNFTPERADIVIMMGEAIAPIIDSIRPSEAYCLGDYLMSVIMQCYTPEQAKQAVYDAAVSDELHNNLAEYIAVLIGK